ncbi:hypothetical protein OAO42_01115 [Candidatus Izimaplasma bacterium]|nr:hypothetical protein [Candidatus Izimaplasma bacterium]
MKINKEKKQQLHISKKTVMFVLILLSLVVSSSTLAYWSLQIGGAEDTTNFTFQVGSINYVDYDFVINNESVEGQFIIDNELLVINKTPIGEEINVMFGVLWEDSERINEDGTITTARIELSYEIYGEIDGVEYNRSKNNRISGLLDIIFDSENPQFIELNSTTETFGLTISIDQNTRKTDYRFFAKSDLMIIVSYTIIYETTEPTT